MGLPDLYPAQVGSPYTTLAAPYTTGGATMTVADATKLPDAPNIVCLAGAVAGEFTYSGKDGNILQGVTVLPGTPAVTTWPAGTFAFRGITAYDLDALINYATKAAPLISDEVYYVNADTGDDTRTKTSAKDPATPWKTLQHAEDQIAPGDTVYIAPGTYSESHVESGCWTSTKGRWIAQGTVIVTKGGVGTSSSPAVFSGNGVAEYVGITFDAENAWDYAVSLGATANNKTFNGCTFKEATQYLCYYNAGCNNIRHIGCMFTLIGFGLGAMHGNPGTSTFEGCTFNITGYWVALFQNGTVADVTFRGCSIYGAIEYTVFDVDIATMSLTVDNNTITVPRTFHSLLNGVRSNRAGTIRIINNHITFTKTAVPAINMSVGNQFATEIANNNIVCTGPTQLQSIISISNQAAPNIYGNYIESFGSAVTHISVGSTGNVGVPRIVGNTLKARTTSGYIIAVGTEETGPYDNLLDGAIITDNVIYGAKYFDPSFAGGSTHSIFVGHSANALIARNTIIGSNYGVVVKGSPVTYTSGGIFFNRMINCVGRVGTIRVKGVKDLKVANNTIYNAPDLTGALNTAMDVSNNIGGDDSTGLQVKNNIFVMCAGPIIATYTGDDVGWDCDHNSYLIHSGDAIICNVSGITKTFVDWQADGYDANGRYGDPDFASLTQFTLSATSPCRDGGDNAVWTGVVRALDGNGSKITDKDGVVIASGGVVDMGAIDG